MEGENMNFKKFLSVKSEFPVVESFCGKVYSTVIMKKV